MLLTMVQKVHAVAIKAVVKDASGNLLAGVPVVFTVDQVLSTRQQLLTMQLFTQAQMDLLQHVFNWKTGKQTITATAGGKSSTDYLTWACKHMQRTARVLSATATGDIVSLKVVDRFGNAVQGVTINLSRTGAGLFGNGASTQTSQLTRMEQQMFVSSVQEQLSLS
jgi:hypothetical protein